jgi:mitochondrial-processing peptidase subunit beta
MDKAHVAIAFEGASWTSEYAFPFMLMQLLLGSYDRTAGMGRNVSTQFNQAVAEAECAHSMSCFNTAYKDTGLFGVYFVSPDKKLDDMMYITLENLMRLVHVITDEEVECAKVDLKANMLMALDGNSNITEDIGRQLLTYGRRLTAAEIFSRIDAITASDIKATAAKFINDQDHALAAVGCIHELQDYAWIRRHSYWLRY